MQCNFWHLHYVRKSQLDSHHASCQHRLEKEAFKVTWECKLTFCPNFSLLDHFWFDHCFFQPRRPSFLSLNYWLINRLKIVCLMQVSFWILGILTREDLVSKLTKWSPERSIWRNLLCFTFILNYLKSGSFYRNRVPQGLSKSKRQDFREKELERLRQRG